MHLLIELLFVCIHPLIRSLIRLFINFILSFGILLVIWNVDLVKCIFVIHSLVNFQLLQFFRQLVQFILKFDFVHVSVVVIDLHDGIVDDSVVVVCDHLLFVLNDFDEDLIGGLNWS